MSVDVNNTLFERIGGAATIDRLVEAFYRNMDTTVEATRIRAMHPADLGAIKTDLKRYLGEWTGGPKLYTSEKGHPQMRRRHLRFAIATPERDAWLMCMREALSETIADEAARAQIDAGVTRLASWIRNTEDGGDEPAN